MERRESRAAQFAAGFVIALIGGIIYLLVQLFRYRPQPYLPAQPDHEAYYRSKSLAPFKDVGGSILVVIFSGALLFTTLLGARQLNSDLRLIQYQSIEFQYGLSLLAGDILILLIAAVLGEFVFRYLVNPPKVKLPNLRDRAIQYASIYTLMALLIWLPIATFVYGTVLMPDSDLWLPMSVADRIWLLLVTTFCAGGLVAAIIYGFSFPDLKRRQRVVWEQAAQLFASLPEPEPKAVTCYTLYPPRSKAEYIAASKFLKSLLLSAPRLTLQIVAGSEAITWRILDELSLYNERTIKGQLAGMLRQGMVDVSTFYSDLYVVRAFGSQVGLC